MMIGRLFKHLQTLRTQSLLAIVLIVILHIVLIGLGMATWDRRVLAKQSAQELSGLARGLAGQLELYMDNLLHTTRAIAALPEIVSLDPAQQEPLLKALFHHYARFARLSTFDLSGSRLASSHPGGAPSIAVQQSFQTVARHGRQAWEVATSLSGSQASLLIHTPIRDAERQVVGVVGADIDLEKLSAVVGGVPVGGGGPVFVLDSAGRVLVSSEKAAEQKRHDYSWVGVPTGGRPPGAATVRYRIDHETLVAGYAPVPNVNWTLVVERPEQLLLATAQRSWHLALAGLGTSTGLVLLIATVLARRLTGRVQALTTADQVLAAGDATVSLVAPAAHGSQMWFMLEAFTAMREAVVEREKALRQRETEAEQRRREAEVLTELARTLNTSLDLDTVLLRLAEGAKALCQADMASLALRDPQSGVMILRYWDGRRAPASEEIVIEAGKGVGGQVLLTGRLFRTDNYAQDPRLTQDYLAPTRKRRSVTVVAAPIALSDQIEGLLYVANRTAKAFTKHDETILLQLADHAAVAIRNARLYQQQMQRQAELRTLLDISKQIGQTSSLPLLLDTIAREAARLLDVPVVIVRQREGDDLVLASFWGEEVKITLLPRVKSGEDLTGLVIASRQPVIINDVSNNDQISAESLAFRRRYGLLAYLGCPLIAGDELLGTLTFHGRSGRHFAPAEVELVQAFATQAAMALRNARLYQEAQDAYRQLVHTQEQLLHAQKMEVVGRLAGGVAHDFNNLFTVIFGRVQLLLERGLTAEPVRRDVEQIQAAANHAASLTRQLLAFSRKQVLQPSVLDLNALVADASTMLRRLLGEDIALTAAFDPTLGRVKADRGQLDQVLLNLVVNARDAMPQGGQLTIETANVCLDDAFVHGSLDLNPGAYVRLVVSDTGMGMDAKTHAHLFEPFFTTKGPGQGTGLGLATVYGIVAQSGGHISVDSVLGQGTTFTIYLPHVEGAVGTIEPESAQEGPHRGTETIMLVEDHTAVRDIAQHILQQHGYTVLVAANGDEALQHSAQHHGSIHLLLTDVVMPGMSGHELAEHLAHLHPETRRLYMSGYTDDALSHHGVLDPGTALLPKPFKPDDLLQKVHEVLHTVHTGGKEVMQDEG